MMNILNGGAHADTDVDVQEFMIAPDRGADLPRGAAAGRRGLPRAQVRAEEEGPGHRPRRRGRLRPGPAEQPRGARPDRRGRRARPASSSASDIALALDVAATRVLHRRRLPLRGQQPHRRADAGLLRRPRRRLPDRLHRGPARRGGLGRLDGADRRARRRRSRSSATTCSSPTPSACQRGIDRAVGQRAAGQGQPDRHADRDPGRRRPGPPQRLPLHDEPPLRRDRGHHHRRPGRRHQLRPDQDRRPGPLRAGREVQPAAAHRGGRSTTPPATPVAAPSRATARDS